MKKWYRTIFWEERQKNGCQPSKVGNRFLHGLYFEKGPLKRGPRPLWLYGKLSLGKSNKSPSIDRKASPVPDGWRE